jgi:hypothetical protein
MRILITCLVLAITVHADEPDYVRFVEDARGASLDTAITQFTNTQGATVDLVGAVHIADKSYYRMLNERFKTYDAVLYELVGGPMPKQGSIENRARDPKLMWLSELHVRMQKSLDLASQLKEIDYQVPNFVHADMTVEQFEAAKEQKNESFLSLMVKAFAVQTDLADGKKSPGLVKLLEILCRQDSATELKRYVGREFDSMETLMAGIEAGDGTVIVTERNKIALGVMEQQLKLGRKKLAIFYGAAHLPKMQAQLATHGFKPVKTEWLKAWSLPPEEKARPATP